MQVCSGWDFTQQKVAYAKNEIANAKKRNSPKRNRKSILDRSYLQAKRQKKNDGNRRQKPPATTIDLD